MITKYKLFENDENKLGYFVLIKNFPRNEGMIDNVYEIIMSDTDRRPRFKIDYKNGCWIDLSDIEKMSKNREELENILKEKKYNL